MVKTPPSQGGVKAGFGSQDKKTTGINLSATVMGTGGGVPESEA